MASGTGAEEPIKFQPQRFEFFISYASEDRKIAVAVETMIKTGMGPSANVFMDKALSFGESFAIGMREGDRGHHASIDPGGYEKV